MNPHPVIVRRDGRKAVVMRVLVIKHHDIDDPGFIGSAFTDRGAVLVTHLVPDDGPLPPLDGIDHIVVLGAAWSVYDTKTIGHWIDSELDWLRGADAGGVPVLGICFGAQALAAALGGRVEPAPRPEIGWTTIESLGPGPDRGRALAGVPQRPVRPAAESPAAGQERAVRPGLRRGQAPGGPVPP
jgi:GMP synthase-like glutamine amidotransferase